MFLNESPTELTTSATDAMLAIECVVLMAFLWHLFGHEYTKYEHRGWTH